MTKERTHATTIEELYALLALEDLNETWSMNTVARILGVTRHVAKQWRQRGYIPPSYFFDHRKTLADLNITADERIWQRPAAQDGAQEAMQSA